MRPGALVPAPGKEALAFRHRAMSAARDRRDAGAAQAAPREPIQIREPFAVAMRREAGGGAGIGCAERIEDVGAHFERARPDGRTEPRHDVARLARPSPAAWLRERRRRARASRRARRRRRCRARSANSTGRQSAVRTPSTTPGARVTAASAVGGDASSAATLSRRPARPASPCTCASHTRRRRQELRQAAPVFEHGGELVVLRRHRRADVERRARADGDAAVARRRQRQRTCGGASHAGTIQSSPAWATRCARPAVTAVIAHCGAPRAAPPPARRNRPAAALPTACAARVTGCTSPSRCACSAWRGKCARRRQQRRSGCAAAAIRRVAQQRMADRRQVHADLVRAAGLQPAADERRGAEALDDLDVRARRLAGRDDGHRRALRRMAADRRIDRRRAREVAVHDRQVLALDRARLQLADEIGLRFGRLGDDHEAARVLVEAVHDARARQRRQRRRVMQQRVQQRAVAVAAARMHDQAGGLVDDEDRGVLVHDRQARSPAARTRSRADPPTSTTAMVSPPRSLCRGSVAATASTVTWPASIQPLSRLRECCGQQLRERLVEPQPGRVAGTVSAWRAVRRREGRPGPWVGYNSRHGIGNAADADERGQSNRGARLVACVLLALALAGCSWLPERARTRPRAGRRTSSTTTRTTR